MSDAAPDPGQDDAKQTKRTGRTHGGWGWLAGWFGLLIALGTALAACVLTERGSAALLSLAARASHGTLVVEGWQGRLWDHWQARRIGIHLSSLALEIESLDLRWQPLVLAHGRLQVDALRADSISVRTAPSSGPAKAPASLALSLAVHVDAIGIAGLSVGSLSAQGKQAAPSLLIHDIAGSIVSDGGTHRVSGLRLTLPGVKLSGDAQLGAQSPFALQARVHLATRFADRQAEVDTSASGSLLAPVVDLQVRGEGVSGSARVMAHPFEPMPLRSLQLALTGIDPSAFQPSAPRAKLDVSAQLVPQAGATTQDWRVAGSVSLRNREPAAFDKQGLPLRQLDASIAWDSRRLAVDDLRVMIAGGSMNGRASWQPVQGDALGRIDSTLALKGVDAQGLVSSLRAWRLDGRITAQTTAREQAFSLGLETATGASGGPRVHAELVGRQRDGVLYVERVALTAAQAQARLHGSVALGGERRFAFQGNVTHFDPQLFSATAPQGDLNLQLQAQGVVTPNWRVAGKLALADSQLAGYPLSGKAEADVSADRVQAADVDLDVLGNRLTLQGALGKPTDTLNFKLDAPRLDRLAQGLGGTAHAEGMVGGSFAELWGLLDAQANAVKLPGGMSLASVAAHARLQPGAQGAFEASVTLDKLAGRDDTQYVKHATLTSRGTREQHTSLLEAALWHDENLRMKLAGGLVGTAWQGMLTEFVGSGPVAFRLTAPATLELGPQRVALGAAQLEAEQGKVALQQTEWTPQRIVARGHLSGLQVGLSLDEYQRTVMRGNSLRMGGDWDVTFGETANGLIKLYREDGDFILQGDAPVALGLANLDINAAAQDGRLVFSANVNGSRIGAFSAVLTAAAERVGSSVRLVPDSPLVGVANIDIPSTSWIGPVIDQNLRTGGSLKGEFNISGTPSAPRGEGKVSGEKLSLALADQGLRLSDGSLGISFDADELRLDRLDFSSRQSMPPPDQRAAVAANAPGHFGGSGTFSLKTGQGDFSFKAERVAVLQNPNQWVLVSGPAKIHVEPERVALDADLRADAGFIGVPKGSAPSLSSDVVVRGQVSKPPQRLHVDARVRFDLGDAFYIKAYGIDTRLSGELSLNQAADGRWAMRGAIDTNGGEYAAYGQRLSIERGTVSFMGPIDNPALNVVALRKGLAVEAGVEVTGTARAPRVRLVSEPNVPEAEKLSWLLLGRASEANSRDTGLLLSAASAALGNGEGEGLIDKVMGGVGLDQLSIGQSSDATRPLSSRVANGATGTTSSAGLDTTPQDQVLTVGKRLSSRAYLALEQNLTGTESVVKLTLFLNRFLSLIARAGTDNALDLQYSISFR